MSNVRLSQVYDATPAAVWAVVGDPAALANWLPPMAESPVSGDQRTCTLAEGGTLKEQILRHSDEDRSYTYRVIESPLPMRDYMSTISVQPDGGGARLTWESEFEAVGAPSSEVETMIRGFYGAGLAGVGELLKKN